MLSPSCGHGMQSLPVVGLVTAAVGIWIAAKALRGGDVKASGKPPRHAAKTSSVRPILFFGQRRLPRTWRRPAAAGARRRGVVVGRTGHSCHRHIDSRNSDRGFVLRPQVRPRMQRPRKTLRDCNSRYQQLIARATPSACTPAITTTKVSRKSVAIDRAPASHGERRFIAADTQNRMFNAGKGP